MANNNKMLIDAAHPEETRVVVARSGSNRIEEFDFESANRKQLRGNIYLAKVTRVEPSLQAAFVEYGGNRHGFLAFSEIHPDYYQIPVADRQALLDEEEREHAHGEEDDGEEKKNGGHGRRRRRGRGRAKDAAQKDETVSEDAASEGESTEGGETADEAAQDARTDRNTDEDNGADDRDAHSDDDDNGADESDDDHDDDDHDDDDHDDDEDDDRASGEAESAEAGPSGDETQARGESEPNGDVVEVRDEAKDEIESVGAESNVEEEMPRRREPRRTRHYKIQEVIKRRQVLLVQAVKEERGTKGAALTTYLSLAGRYCVLMPNTARGGGISRKVTNAADRKKMKEIAEELDVPEGMGVILRTAGASRTKPEIKRDFEYLLRLWETVRGKTLSSTAPSLVHEEGSLVKRAIRDLYNKDIDEVQVSGEAAFKEAKDFMRMLIPSHAKNVKLYRDAVPIFSKYGVDNQLDAMFSNVVTLKSGGYIVINQTEALVAVDVNSGRATREHNIEDTALRTNLEAAEEVSRQLRLRDLAGLIVVDFIDMEENRNNRAVEKRLKECLKHDRARIQVGRISHFGLLEMSRQRIRTGVLESSSDVCPVCAGSGRVRSVPSVALHVLRMIEEHLLKNAGYNLNVRTTNAVALYILNQKRGHLRDIETRFGVEVTFVSDEHLAPGEHCVLQRGEPSTGTPLVVAPPPPPVEEPETDEDADAKDDAAESEGDAGTEAHEDGENGGRRRRRRRRRGRGGRGEGHDEGHDETASGDDAENGQSDTEAVAEAGEESAALSVMTDKAEGEERRPRRRGRRGGRRGRERGENGDSPVHEQASEADVMPGDASDTEGDNDNAAPAAAPVADEAPAPAPEPVQAVNAKPDPEAPPPAPKASEPAPAVEDPNRPKRVGWWNRLKG